mgnify:CR=1 FL=1
MNRRNLFFALKRAATQNEIVVNGFIFDEPFSLQSILEQHASKFRNKKITTINLLSSFAIRDCSRTSERRSGLNNIHVKKKISFINCQFKHHVNFASAIFEDELYFADCNFDGGLKLCSSLCKGVVDIQRCTFGLDLDLSSAELAGSFNLSSSVMQNFTAHRTKFDKMATFRGVDIARIVIISKAIFQGFTEFSHIKFSYLDSGRNDLGGNRITFDHTEFKYNTDFGGAVFGYHVSFKGCRFSHDVYFGPARTDITGSNRETIFKGTACFNGAIFMRRSYFLVEFTDSADFSDIVVTGQLFLYLNAAKQLNFKNAVVGDNFNFSPHIDENLLLDRETVQKFKHVSIQQHNTISAMRYKAREMTLYKRELQQDIKETIKQIFHFKTQKKTPSQGVLFKIGEWFLLSLNQLSNNFGLSWMRGVCFTLCAWILFFTLTVYTETSIGKELIWFLDGKRLYQSLEYFWLFNLADGLPEKTISVATLFPFLTGKVFIGYGIYQTISAFRKHGKL